MDGPVNDLPWELLRLAWIGTELALMVVLTGAAVVQRSHRGIAASLGIGAACSGWFAFHAVASWVMIESGVLGGSEAMMVSTWVLQPVSRIAGLVLWIALAYAALAPRLPTPTKTGNPTTVRPRFAREACFSGVNRRASLGGFSREPTCWLAIRSFHRASRA